MPNKINIEEIKKQLPPFANIVESSYKGARYNAEFMDIEYNEMFIARPRSVIALQHGCASRSNKLRSESTKGKYGAGVIKPIKEVKNKLPPFLTINEETYTGARYEAEFYDNEYNITFTAIVANILKGKGYCKERFEHEFKRQITIPADEIQARVNVLYKGRLKLIAESYIDTQTVCLWEKDGERVRLVPFDALSGRVFMRRSLLEWRESVIARDGCACQRCREVKGLVAHHILTFSKDIENRLNIDNGITLCGKCHDAYHSKYKNEETIENLCDFINIESATIKIKNRLS